MQVVAGLEKYGRQKERIKASQAAERVNDPFLDDFCRYNHLISGFLGPSPLQQSPFVLKKLFVRERFRIKAVIHPLYHYQRLIFFFEEIDIYSLFLDIKSSKYFKIYVKTSNNVPLKIISKKYIKIYYYLIKEGQISTYNGGTVAGGAVPR